MSILLPRSDKHKANLNFAIEKDKSYFTADFSISRMVLLDREKIKCWQLQHLIFTIINTCFFKSLGLYNNISPKISGMVPVQCAMTMYEVRPEALLSVIPSLKTVPAWTFQPIQPIKDQKGQRNWPYTTVHSFNFGLEDHLGLNNSANQRPKRPTELALHNSPLM